MLIPDGCDCHLTFPSSSEPVNCLVSNRDHTIILVVTDASVYFYQAETKLLSCILKREEDDVNERGPFRRAYWKPDSTAICITTANNFLNIYSVEITQTPSVFNLHDPVGEDKAFARQSTELFLVKNRVQITVHLTVIARLEAEPKCVLSFKDELLLSLNDGWLHRLNWSGNVLSELSFNIQTISSQEKEKGQKQKRSNLHILDVAPFLGGICGVFNDGRAALLVSNSPDFKSDSLTLIWANGMVDACCCSTNFKFRLIYFGCKNGDIAGYSLDEVNGGLVQSFRIHLTLKNGTEYLDRLASVRQISCLSPQGTAFAAIWERKILDEKKLPNGHQSGISSNFIAQQIRHCPPTLAIFSPFGEQWWCSLEDNYSGEANGELQSNLDVCLFTTLDWAIDGFQLWLGTSNGGIQLINTIRSIPNSHDHLMMVGADRIFLCPTDNTDQLAKSAPHLIWQQFKPPNNYIASNWPIKHIAIGHNPERILVVGGSHGFCTYTFKHSKWRMFRKEAQEKSLLLTGGVVVFGEFILCSACNLDAPSDEADRLYVFRAEEQLDLDLAHFSLTNRILEMKLSGSNLITFDVNSMVNIYSISVQLGGNKNKKTAMELEMECIAEIRIAEFLHHPNCLVSLELAKLNFHSDALPFCGEKDSLLINVSGHLLLLSPMQPQQMNGRREKNGENETADDLEFQLHPPTLVASFVEEFWIIHSENGNDENGQIPYLSEAIWINAGCKKSRIWLPLLIEMERKKSMSEQKQKPQLVQQNSRTFISRRIMLPFAMDIYPLFIDNIYLACGATCNSLQLKTAGGKPLMGDDVSLTSKFTEDDSLNDFVGLTRPDEGNPPISMHTIARTSEVFIHKLLRQLLKRNLGSYAFELASSCRPLPYFQHILELLLHDLLDEEATSSEPIPDPLLPTVVSFLREFPAEYLQTIVHCARKTELAFWNLLFSVSNHPRQLFQMCLQEGQLQTATSCLIILHSLISIQESSKLAFQLLEEALSKRRWNVAQDILRFMQNINRATERDSVDFGDQPESPPLQSKLATFPHPPHHHPMNNLPFNSSADEFNFPLFSSQIDIEPSNVSSSVAAAFVQQRRRSGSGKMAATADSSHPKHISAFSRKQQSTAKPNSPPNTGKEKGAAKSPPPLAMPSKNDQTHYSGLDEILSKHAANLLENYALRDLGAFCSFLPLDFSDFFKRPENVFSIPAEEFPLVLMKLHAQFNWPYPIGDSGQLPSKNIIERINGSIIMADEAKSANGRQRGDSINSASTSTTGGGAFSDLGGGSTSSTSTTLICDWKVLEKISEKVEKQTEQADTELAFIFDQLQRAEAFEWLFLLSILRRDIPLFNEKVLARMREFKDQGRRLELFLARIRDGTRVLHNWAQTICPAYQPVMLVFKQFVECDDS